MLESVEWGEYRLGDLFKIEISKSIDEGKVKLVPNYRLGLIEFIGRTTVDNGIKGYTKKLAFNPNPSKVISVSQIGTITAQIRNHFWYASQNIFILTPKEKRYEELISLFGVSAINKSLSGCFEPGYSKYPTLCSLKELKINLPIQNHSIDYGFMERFIAQLNAARLKELNAYLSVTGLKDYTLTPDEEQVIEDFEKGNIEWRKFIVGELFGDATRGKRLKSEDRISGNLPFVTAGEANTGISAFIGNKVEIFKSNTITIDMFGSAKYRNYTYGADDHVAVLHTEDLPKNAVCFITAAIHKVANAGDFHYGRNFYAKDAAPLKISLLASSGRPDYSKMELLISAVQKLVIKDVVLYADKELAATRQVIDKTSK